MITDDEIALLPEDQQLAFVEFERIVRERLYDLESSSGMNERSVTDVRREYINKVLGAARFYNIVDLVEWAIPGSTDDLNETFKQFTSEVDHFTIQVRLRHAPNLRQNSVQLGTSIKTKIHHYIQQIRTAIETAELPDDKRDALFKKLNQFSLEVDKNRTSLQAGMAVYIAVCDGIGQGFQKLEPARKFIDSIAGLMGREKDLEDASRGLLHGPKIMKQLDAPNKRLPAPSENNDDLDSEIPF